MAVLYSCKRINVNSHSPIWAPLHRNTVPSGSRVRSPICSQKPPHCYQLVSRNTNLSCCVLKRLSSSLLVASGAAQVMLDSTMEHRYPHEFSYGFFVGSHASFLQASACASNKVRLTTLGNASCSVIRLWLSPGVTSTKNDSVPAGDMAAAQYSDEPPAISTCAWTDFADMSRRLFMVALANMQEQQNSCACVQCSAGHHS